MTILSIGMIVKNEADKLAATLEALQPLRDNINCQLIIADTGSTDDTLQIAQQYADEAFSIPWESDFAKARNATLQKAKGRWFFYLDADEVLTDSDALIQFFQNPKNQRFQTVKIKIRNITSYDKQIWQDFWSPRIFRIRRDAVFQGAIHEFYPTRDPAYALEGSLLMHSGYNNDDKDFMNYKMQRNVELLEDSLQKETNNMKRCKLLIEYADSISLVDGNEDIGYEKAREAIEILKKLPPQDEKRIYLLARAYSLCIRMRYNQHNLEECLEIGEEYLQVQPERCTGDIDIHYVMGESYWQKNDYQPCRFHFEKFLYWLEQDMLTITKYMVVATMSLDDKVRCYLSQVYQKLDMQEEAWQYALQIKRDTFGGVDLRQFKWQLAINHNSAQRLPQLWETFNEDLQTALLDGITRAMPKASEERRQDILEGLRKIPDNEHKWPLLVLWSNNKAEIEDLLQQNTAYVFQAEEGNILYQSFYYHIPMQQILPHLNHELIEAYLNTAIAVHPSLPYYTYRYYEKQDPESLPLAELRVAQYCLCHNVFCKPLDRVLLQEIWPLARRYASAFMQRAYQAEMLEKANCAILWPLEQFILWAQEGDESYQAGAYQQCLYCYRQGLSVYPQGKDVADMIVEQVEATVNPAAAELEMLAQSIKAQIRELMNAGDLLNANALAEELNTIVPQDEEVRLLIEATAQPERIWN